MGDEAAIVLVGVVLLWPFLAGYLKLRTGRDAFPAVAGAVVFLLGLLPFVCTIGDPHPVATIAAGLALMTAGVAGPDARWPSRLAALLGFSYAVAMQIQYPGDASVGPLLAGFVCGVYLAGSIEVPLRLRPQTFTFGGAAACLLLAGVLLARHRLGRTELLTAASCAAVLLLLGMMWVVSTGHEPRRLVLLSLTRLLELGGVGVLIWLAAAGSPREAGTCSLAVYCVWSFELSIKRWADLPSPVPA